MVIVAVEPSTHKIYVITHFEQRLTFPRQVDKIYDWFEQYDPIMIGIESNAYQLAVHHPRIAC